MSFAVSPSASLLRRCALTLALLLSFSGRSGATHVAAADLYWDYIGTGPTNLKYKVTLVLYRACEWTPISSPPFWSPNSGLDAIAYDIKFTSSCFGTISRNFNMEGQRDTLDQLCANYAPINMCRQMGSVWPAFERIRYTDTITLPGACTDWKASYELCCRNNNITNLLNPGSWNLYVEAGINNVAKWNNSTPRFIIDPIPYLCENQPAFFLNGPLDINNDSMVTINVAPLDPAAIPYAGTYSMVNPFNSPTGYAVDPNTATATFTPPITGKFVIAFECSDYDRTTGTKLSYVRRDVQVAVLNCNASPPDISDEPENLTGGTWFQTPPSGGYLIGCPGVPMEFEVHAQSNTISNSVFLASTNQQVIPASVFSIVNQGTANPVGIFNWTPTGLDIGDYTVIFTAKDSTCNNNQPIVLKNYFVAFIKILPGVDAGPDGRICELDGVPWQIHVTGPPTATYEWTALNGGPGSAIGIDDPTSGSPLAYPPYNMTYVVEATNFTSACKNRDTITVYIDTSNSITASPHEAVMCRPGYFQLAAQGTGLAPLRNMPCGTDEIITCTQEDSAEVRIHYSGGVPIPSNLYTAFPSYRTARMQFLLRQYDLYKYNLRSGTIRSIAFDVNTATTTQYHNFSISLKCTDNHSIKDQTGGMESGTTLVYSAPGAVTVNAGWNEFVFDTPYSWDSTKGLIVEICYSNPAAGTAAVLNAVNDSTSSMAIRYSNAGSQPICQNPSIAATTAYYGSRPIVRFRYCPSDTVPFPYTWTPGVYLSDSTSAVPLAYLPKSTTYYVSTVGRNGCKVVDSVVVKIPEHEYDVWPYDTTFCAGEPFLLRAIGDFAEVQWYEDTLMNAALPVFAPATSLSCEDCREAVGRPLVSTKYYAVMTDDDGCSDTMTVKAIVKPLPTVNILNRDTFLKYGQSVQLLVSGAYLYSWQPVSSLSNPNIVNPVATPAEPTLYYVYGVAENGCRNVDSIMVHVDYRDHLYVPTAFTPNGDGKNDVFRVANLTFQRLLEFRVFNRWGQEVFHTTDPLKGWDGSWKGVPQDMGVFQYLVRVAYPDGVAETYRGNVTLIR